MSKKIGVLLVQMGGPCCLANVEDFLFNLFKDEHIIQLPFFIKPFQKILAKAIARKRAPEVSKLYQKIGGRSPILYETQLQTKLLSEKLSQRNDGNIYKAYFAMRYSYPFLKDTLPDILEDNLNELFVIPLYPQYSTATTESNFAECRELFSKHKLARRIPIKYITSWEDNEFFIAAWVQRIRQALQHVTSNNTHLLFSAHSLPEKYVLNGDPYQKQIIKSVEAIMFHFENVNYSISYQSKVGPVKWLEPSTETEIKKLANEKIENLIVVPISFVGDHIETVYEIDMLYRDLAKAEGIANFVMVKALKDDPLLIAALVSLV